MPTLISHVWKPSNARALTIDSFLPVPRGTTAVTPLTLNWPVKDPADVLDYQLDIGPALTGNADDAIQDVDITIDPSQPGDLSADNILADGSRIVIWFSAGQAGVTYTVTAQIVLTSGRSIQRSILLPVLALSTPSAPADAITSSANSPLTDQNGNPISSM